MKFLITMILLSFSLILFGETKLTTKELDIIDTFIDKTPTKDLIGQLFMIGLKTDMGNVNSSLTMKNY